MCVRARVRACVLQPWVVLGQVDLEKLVEKHLDSVQDWERNFKALKARGKESERLPRYKPADGFTTCDSSKGVNFSTSDCRCCLNGNPLSQTTDFQGSSDPSNYQQHRTYIRFQIYVKNVPRMFPKEVTFMFNSGTIGN